MPNWLKSEIKPSCTQALWSPRNSWSTRGFIFYQISYAYCNSNWLVKLNRTSLSTSEDLNCCILTNTEFNWELSTGKNLSLTGGLHYWTQKHAFKLSQLTFLLWFADLLVCHSSIGVNSTSKNGVIKKISE